MNLLFHSRPRCHFEGEKHRNNGADRYTDPYLQAGHCFKHFRCINSFTPHYNPSIWLPWWHCRKESASIVRDPGSIPGSGRSPGEGNGNPLQYSCLENPMDRGAWQTTIHGITESDTTQRLLLPSPCLISRMASSYMRELVCVTVMLPRSIPALLISMRMPLST